MLDGSWLEHQGISTSPHRKGVWLVFLTGFVTRQAVTTAIATNEEHHMRQTPPPSPPDKEGPFLPRMNDGGTLARFGEPFYPTSQRSISIRLDKTTIPLRFF
jgi:hypothetical protein